MNRQTLFCKLKPKKLENKCYLLWHLNLSVQLLFGAIVYFPPRPEKTSPTLIDIILLKPHSAPWDAAYFAGVPKKHNSLPKFMTSP